MPEPAVLYDQSGHVVRLTINRPHAMNAMDIEAHETLSACLDRCETDDAVRVVVLTGSGDRAFSVGRDLHAMAAEGALGAEEKGALDRRWSNIRRLTDRHGFTKPVVGRINGLALGGGFELALACDILVAVDSAAFALPEPKRGFIPFAGGIHRLPRQMPLKTAMGLMLTARQLSSQRAYELGLLNAVVPREALDEEVGHWVTDILACAPLAVRAVKQSAMQGLARGLSEAMAAKYDLESAVSSSADRAEGIHAFAEKRKPLWTGA
jgi:enoyl-CoA hydratase/carnithine racemase